MSTLTEQLISKMGLHDEPSVLGKTTELLRLLELRSTNMPLQVNEYGKIVLCVDMAADVLGIGFDKEHALKLSGLRKTLYVNHKRMFEKLLDLNKIVGVQDICIQLGLNEVAAKAKELLELYRKVVELENPDVDVLHPQYATMAVFQACKLSKKKVSKSKLMPFSNLKPAQWQQLELRWEQFLQKHYKPLMDSKLVKQGSEDPQEGNANPQRERSLAKANTPLVEDYDKWKSRMLELAASQLREQERLGQVEKENLVLGM